MIVKQFLIIRPVLQLVNQIPPHINVGMSEWVTASDVSDQKTIKYPNVVLLNTNLHY